MAVLENQANAVATSNESVAGRKEDFVKRTTMSIGFCDLLLLVFIVLKLTGVIAWSWVWVLAPLWIPFIIVIILGFIVNWGRWGDD